MILYSRGSVHEALTPEELRSGLYKALDQLGSRKKVLLIPPDHTRLHSRAGELTVYAYQYYGDAVADILPALGTHNPMDGGNLDRMFPGIPHSLFRTHNWRTDVRTLGEVPGSYIQEITDGALSYAWPVQLNKLISEGGHDLVLSLGQVVPHEVIGMANFNKNLLIGCGGPESINKSHFLGAVWGMERIMGRADNPVRQLLNYADRNYLKDLPLVYVHTVVGNNGPGLAVRGLFIGDDPAVFVLAADLSLRVNFTMVDQPLEKVVVYLDPEEYRSTWLGNKAIYRTRMAIADGGELIVMAPGVREFGEDPEIDRLIRKYGYKGTEATLQAVAKDPQLGSNLSAAAHLIHGSSEGRFDITWCPGKLSQDEIEAAGFRYADPRKMMELYPPGNMQEGYNRLPTGEEVYYISNPAVGLWSTQSRFHENHH
jgi:nickel-dependent lactate racemase